MSNRAIVEEWIEYGGALYLDTNPTGQHEVRIRTTRDEDVMADLYGTRSDDYKDYSFDDFLKVLARKALEYMKYSQDEIENFMMGW